MNTDDYMRLSEEVWPIKKNSVFKTCTPNPTCPPVADLTHFGALVEREARREALEQAVDKVAFHGGSVEIEAAIRALIDPIPAGRTKEIP